MVLRELSLQVPRGSIYGFLGPNGAGKTTALRMFLGLLRPVSGTVRLFGDQLPAGLPENLRRVGSLIDQPSVYAHLTGFENLDIIRKVKGLRPSATDGAICAAGVEPFARRRVKEYSRGMRQRLGVAMAIIGNPELLVLDEPMNWLDAHALQEFRSLLIAVNQEYGATVLLSSHQLEEIDQLATHIGILGHAGDLLFEGTRKELAGLVPQQLLIKVDQRDEALAVLEKAGFTVDSRQGHLIIHSATTEMARDANRILVLSKVGVYHLSIEQATLERQVSQVLATIKVWNRV
jgi:ABC-2 type transport system ATP-binding protein